MFSREFLSIFDKRAFIQNRQAAILSSAGKLTAIIIKIMIILPTFYLNSVMLIFDSCKQGWVGETSASFGATDSFLPK